MYGEDRMEMEMNGEEEKWMMNRRSEERVKR
jgi:hypothetical protein